MNYEEDFKSFENAYINRDHQLAMAQFKSNMNGLKPGPESVYNMNNISNLKKRNTSHDSVKKKRKGQASIASARRTV